VRSVGISGAKHVVQPVFRIPDWTWHGNPELAQTRGADGNDERRNRFEATRKIIEALAIKSLPGMVCTLIYSILPESESWRAVET
jgi:hypothetical protein